MSGSTMSSPKALLVKGVTLGNRQDALVHDRMEAVGTKREQKLLKDFFTSKDNDDFILLHLENNIQIDFSKENGEVKISIWHPAFMVE